MSTENLFSYMSFPDADDLPYPRWLLRSRRYLLRWQGGQ